MTDHVGGLQRVVPWRIFSVKVTMDGPSSEIASAWADFYLEDVAEEFDRYSSVLTIKVIAAASEFGEVMEAVVQRFCADNPMPVGTEDRPYYRGYLTMKGLRAAPRFDDVKDDDGLQRIILSEDIAHAAQIAIANPSFCEPFKTAFDGWIPRFRELVPEYASELGL